MKPWTATPWRLDPEGAATTLDDGATMRLRFLSPSMARLSLRPAAGWREPRTWAIAPEPGRDVPWEGRARDDDSGFAPPPLEVFDDQGVPGLDAGALAVTLQHAPLRLRWTAGRGGPLLAEDRRTTAYARSARTGALRHYLQRDERERYHGLGDKTGPLNLHGRRLRTLAMDSLGYDPEHGDPLYKHWPFVLSRTPEGRWLGLYYDTLAACTFDLGCEHDNYHGFYRHVEIDDGDLDLYLMAGATPGEVIAQFVRLIGGTALPPRWALGYAQTAMGLADATDAQARLHAFIDEIRAHRVPVSAFHYGSGYSMRGPRRYVYTWNRDKFPEPQALNARFHAQGLHVVANIKPCLLDDHPSFGALARDGGFVVDGEGRPVVEPYWDGQAAFLDFTHPQGLRWWQEGLRRQILDMGIDAGWNDNNEHAVQDESAQSHGFGTPLPIHRSRPLHALLMTRATWEAQRERAAPGEPVYTVTRAGPPGIQRYAQTWSGDNGTSWRTLKWNIRTGLQMSLSGLFNVGHDVGGFHGPVPEPELFARWVQACCLNPRMVMNSWKAGNVVNLPWMHPEVADTVRAAIELRYHLLPYLWQLFERAAEHHEPIIRPTFFDFPDDAQCLQDSDDFMLGPDLLVAPVVEPGQHVRRVWLPVLPAGACWFDFHTRQRYASGAWHTVAAPLDVLPLFARAGARIPVAAAAPGALATVDDAVHEVVTF